MKVTILTEGGRDTGYGHITRCTSVYQAFEERGIKSQLIVNGDETIKNLLKGKLFITACDSRIMIRKRSSTPFLKRRLGRSLLTPMTFTT